MGDDIVIETTKRELEPEERCDSRNLINEEIGNEVGLIENPVDDEIEGVGRLFESLLCKQLKKEGYQMKDAKLKGTGESKKILKT
jgi:hypothetical protein